DAALPRAPFIALAAAAPSSAAHDTACAGIAEALGCPAVGLSPQDALRQALEAPAPQISARMMTACTVGEVEKKEVRAVSLPHFAAGLFGPASPEGACRAARGLLLARSLCDRPNTASPLPSFRLHWFFRNLEGLWACTMPGCQCQAGEQGDGRTAGKLF